MKITFAAILDGTTVGTRSSGTMPYTHAVIATEVNGVALTVVSWHMTIDAAHKAARTQTGYRRGIQVVPATPIKVSGTFDSTGPNAETWAPIVDAALVTTRQLAALAQLEADQAIRDEILNPVDAEIDAKKANARAIAERLNAEAADNSVKPTGAGNVRMAAARDRARQNSIDTMNAEAAEAIDVQEPVVSVTTEGDVQSPEGSARPIVKKTRENMAACAAVGLSYWSGHPTAGLVWAVDAYQTAHPVHVDRKNGTAAIGDYELSRSSASAAKVVGDSVYVPWSIDSDQAVLDAQFTVISAELKSQRAITTPSYVGGQESVPIDGRPLVDTAGVDLNTPADKAAIAPITLPEIADVWVPSAGHVAPIDPINFETVATNDADTVPAVFSVHARKAMLGDMVQEALGKMIADMTADDHTALGDDEAVTAQLKAWLRRSGRAFVFKDGHNVTGGDTD